MSKTNSRIKPETKVEQSCFVCDVIRKAIFMINMLPEWAVEM